MFDLNEGLTQLGLDGDKLIGCFGHYLALEGRPITRANAEERMLKKLNQSLIEDIAPLLPAGISYSEADAMTAFGNVWGELIARIPGDRATAKSNFAFEFLVVEQIAKRAANDEILFDLTKIGPRSIRRPFL